MTIKINKTNKKSNVIQFTKYINKKKNTLVSSTIAAIIAVKIDHPENIEPEDYLIDKIEFPSPNKNIEKVLPNENFKVIK